MGSSAKTRTVSIYGSLIRMYPQSFQRQYSTTMLQTFDDMLQAEPSKFGRLRIWIRAILDVPVSAAKEHITNREGMTMSRNMKILLGAVFVVLILGNAASWWFGNLHARRSQGVEKVTAAQLADAMQQDKFYYTYGDAAVLFKAKVARVTTGNGAALVTFSTNTSYSLVCQFPKAQDINVGQSISVAAPGGSAERQPHGVLLHNCVQN